MIGRQRQHPGWFLFLIAAAASAWPWAASAADAVDTVQQGEQLFLRSMTPQAPRPRHGDGLGPLFNHVSCAACHRQGAIGGGGDIDVNVALLCAQLAQGVTLPAPKLLRIQLQTLHPAFVDSNEKVVPNILLHRFGPGESYLQFKLRLGGAEVPLLPAAAERQALRERLAKEPLPVTGQRGSVRVILVQRNTTALFGAGLIDAIPDDALHALAAAQARQGEVSGRVPPVGPDKVGRFGWRGQIERLHDFVLGACANELGLEVPGHQQPIDPLRPKYRPGGLDLSEEECRSLTDYVASLPAPKHASPHQAGRSELARRGRRVFQTVGCAACHVEQVGEVRGLFSDLLLHDLGPRLADPVLAEPALELVKSQPLRTSGTTLTSVPGLKISQSPGPRQYYGGSSFQDLALTAVPATVRIEDRAAGTLSEYRVQTTRLDQEWRTPPLWGLADSAPYLHDGRAATVSEAIQLHGGEAESATRKFNALPTNDQLAMLVFLRCLKAP